jgi:hypothetical protein
MTPSGAAVWLARCKINVNIKKSSLLVLETAFTTALTWAIARAFHEGQVMFRRHLSVGTAAGGTVIATLS